ncbi:helix-turn-helix domain-containing protein [Chitinimonas arctica]|uniref:Helix-turn-helix domain-containing protein n=1 Tax=Chitinimonas arctica TaxID=2594795 RepID=A0A516SGB9_9NEIS|nr:GyrI-like domain-containing protein [Chitinimonas arctica]QDQ27140.1 helix-turn-helix domain-containing protein [Chitinimonas arctica]
MKHSTLNRYAEQIGKVLDYLGRHRDMEPDLYQLADIANLSPYHFHRVYRGLMGETVAETLRTFRLHLAADNLRRTGKTLPQVATQAGYGSVPAFSRAFQLRYGLPPGQYRLHRSAPPLTQQEIAMYPITLENIAAIPTVALAHRGPYLEIGLAFDKLMLQAQAQGWFSPEARFIGIYHDDPEQVAAPELRSQAALSVGTEQNVKAPFEKITIPAGPCAVLDYTGPYAEMHTAYQWLFAVWLPQSGRQPADFPVFEEYLNDPKTTPPTELKTLIYLPLAA